MSQDSKTFSGRTVLYTDEVEIDSSNISAVMEKAVQNNSSNQSNIKYLYEYYKGKQPILDREKTYNKDINNKVVENRAAELVDFETGYLLSAPIQYIDAANNDINETVSTSDLYKFSTWCEMEGKTESDLEIAQWQTICGTAYRVILPKSSDELTGEEDECPFEFHTLDPQSTFIVYSSKMGHKSMLAATSITLEDNSVRYYAYTDKEFFVLDSGYKLISDDVDKPGTHIMGAVPIIEYPANMARVGDLELVISLLDQINNVQSNRADGIENIIQNILCMEGMAIEPEDGKTETEAQADFMEQLKEVGGLLLPKDAKAYYITSVLNQGDAQTYKDDLYNAVLEITGMPNRNATTQGDTGSAVVLRNGWSAAESRARNREIMFKRAERKFLNIALGLANDIGGTNILKSDVDIRFPRRNYTNDSANVSNLVTMLSNDWIRPEFAYEHSNMTADPHKDYLLAKEWHDNKENETVNQLAVLNAMQSQADDGIQNGEVNGGADNNTTGSII